MTQKQTSQAAASPPDQLVFPVKVSTAEVERAIALGRQLQNEALRRAFRKAFAFLATPRRRRGAHRAGKHQVC